MSTTTTTTTSTSPNKAQKLQGFRFTTRDKVVVVEIGPEQTKYYVHSALLTQHSEYFKKALSGPWREAEEGTVRLEDVDCETFDIFVDWLYTGRLPSKGEEWVAEFKPRSECVTQRQLLKLKVCVFGDRFLAREFQRAVQNALVRSTVAGKGVYHYLPINYAFDNLPSNNPILRLLVDVQCLRYKSQYDTNGNGELQRRDQLSHCFLLRLMVRYSEIIHGTKGDMNQCDYHEHASVEERQSCKESIPRARVGICN